MKILVVHRQKNTVEAIKSVLSGWNPVVRETASGLDGLLTSRIEHFDLIICSTDLPVVTGFELVRSIRTHSVNPNTPVILTSGTVDEKSLRLARLLSNVSLLDEHQIEEQLTEMVNRSIKDLSD